MKTPREREKTHMKCCKCKREIPPESRFCPKCGSPLEFTRELIDRAVNNDQPAITQLYDTTKDNVYYTIKTMISDEDTAQDLTQDTFLKAMKNLGQLNEPAAFRGWIKKIARNMTIDVLRKRKVLSFSQMVSADSGEMIEFEDDRPENLPEVVIDRLETTRLIGEILDTLSAEQRVVTDLFYYEDFSVKEIARELGVSENTVKSRLKYARNKIETGVKELEQKGTKLYSLAPIPFLLLLFKSRDAYAAELPDADILQSIQSGNTSAGAEDSFSGQSANSRNIKEGTASKGVAAKVIAGIVAAALIGGVIAGIMAHNAEDEPQAPMQTAERGEMPNSSEEEEIDTGAEYRFKKISDDGYTMEVEHTYTSHYDAQSGTSPSYKDNEQITWEEFQEVTDNAISSNFMVKDFDWNILAAKDPGAASFLGTHNRKIQSKHTIK